MLPRLNRLTREEFKAVEYVHKREHTNHLSLLYTKNTDTFKSVVIVGKKVFKKAVNRNKIRRSLYGVLEKNKSILPNGVYIVRVKVSAKEVGGKEIQQELQQLINRLIS